MRRNSQTPTGVIGKLFVSLFFLVFLGMGSFFVWFIARDAVVGIRIWTWKQAPCEILASAVRETEEPGQRVGNFEFEVRYRYRFGGQTFTSEQYRRNPKPFSDYAKAARLAQRYSPGSSARCYVNPSAAAEAVLERDNLLALLMVLFPMSFVLIGAGGIYMTWRPKPGLPEGERAISERAAPTRGQRFGILFFAVFLLAGAGALYGIFLRPLFRIAAARTWPAVPCVVISGEVKSHSGDDGDTYSIDILYRYQFNGREFKSNRYHFLGASSSGYNSKAAVVSRYPSGTKTICYVNPADPTEAVLERGFTSDLWFGLIPLLFVAVGAGGIVFTLRQRRQARLEGGAITDKTSLSGRASTVISAAPEGSAEGTLALKPRTAPWVRLLGVMAAALFWNGIVSVFLTQAVKSWRSGRPEWFLTLFLIPFVLIGLGLVGAVLYSLLALFNPRPRLKVTPGAVPLGGTLRVEWEMRGRTDRLRSLRVRLQGREEATYRRGTNTCVDKSIFADLEIAQLAAGPEMRSGSGKVTVPTGLMHSFAAKNNKVIWSIQLHGEIPRWPDVKEEFPLTVFPGK